MTECDYCGEEVRKTEGKMLVLTNGDRKRFCSAKCEKDWQNDRNHGHRKEE
jgi:ribosomal protein L24E